MARNPLVELRRLVAPAARQRRGVVTAVAAGRAEVDFIGGGTASVTCGIAVARGDTVLVVGGQVTARVAVEATKTVKIM